MEMQYVCPRCGRRYPVEAGRWKCSCGGCLSLDFQAPPLNFEALAASKERSLWRYAQALPLEHGVSRRVCMGEGGTPLIPLGDDAPHVLIKGEYFAPTLSFKDRGAAVLMALAAQLGVTSCVADSSGNAGTAIAAYGARLGMECYIYVPASASEKKIAQIKAHGAHIHPISGSREDTAAAAIRQVEKEGAFYASHIYNPFFHQGTKTYVYELYEQLGGRLPDVLIVPVGNGTLLLGVFRGLEDLRRWGMLEKVPLVLAVQAQNCSPIAQAFASGGDHWQPVPTSPTEAEGIAIAAPARGDEMLAALRAWGGQCITVTEEQILTAREQLARRGIYVETTSAANLAALAQYQHACPNWQKQCIVVPACGAGVKSH